MGFRITGKLPSAAERKKFAASRHYSSSGFSNMSDTPMMAVDASYWKMIKDYFKKHPNTAPSFPVPSVRTDLKTIEEDSLVWFGHSSYFIRLARKNILVDPVFSGNAAPVSFMVKAFKGSNVYSVNDMPSIDVLILTHDHYDHLDYKTITRLHKKVKHIYCSLGMGGHLHYWGISKDKITEMDWWQTSIISDDLEITAAPARHFSGRGIKRNQTLWSSFILKSEAKSMYIGGDSGYDTHFKEIGNKYGPFEIALLEAGQYNAMWPFIHMMPEETVQAAVDLRAKALVPVHWGKFMLSMHEWDEPVTRVMKKAGEVNMRVITPMIGEVVEIGKEKEFGKWWMGK